MAFPRYVYKKLADLGASPLADFAYGDVGSPAWEGLHADWNKRVWPVLMELSGARSTDAAAKRFARQTAVTGALTRSDSVTAMHRSLVGGRPGSVEPGSMGKTQPRVLLAPTILTNAAGQQTVVVFGFAASGRELRRFNEIAIGLVLLSAALICQFTSITNTHIGR